MVQPALLIGWAKDASVCWQDIKKAARVSVKKALFDKGPFPSVELLDQMVQDAINDTVTVYSNGIYFLLDLRFATH